MRHHPPTMSTLTRFLLALLLLQPVAWRLVAAETNQAGTGRNEEISMTVGKSVILDHPDEIARISISNPDVADAVAVSTKELLLNAKSAGITTLVIWSKSGERNFFTINVGANLQQLQQQIQRTFPGEDIQLVASNNTVALTGHASSPLIADKAAALAAGSGRTVVNNLSIPVPPDRQVILKVRYAEIQRAAIQQLGVNIISTGATNTIGSTSTSQFTPPGSSGTINGTIGAHASGAASSFLLTNLLNVFAFRPDLNLGATIEALQARNLIQILAEPNVVATSGKEASFLVGGEFPFPVIQGGANAGAVTIQFREFGIKLNFLPIVLPDSQVKLHVRPEVSSLDFSNALTISGFTIPALSTRRVDTDVQLSPGQSFVIAGLIDRHVTENLDRIPGLANIPLLGNIFKSQSKNKNNSELLVLVTPELPTVLQQGEPRPELVYPQPFMPTAAEGKQMQESRK